MRDQYAGDIGDYIKLALLRALAPGRELAVAWFKTVGLDQGGDGKHVTYLQPAEAEKWRQFDPALYDQLNEMAARERNIAGLEAILQPLTLRFFDRPIRSMSERSVWYTHLRSWALRSDILFLDPDNGISTPGTASIKSVSREEIDDLLGAARTLVVYHHHTRRKGGHEEEMRWIGESLVPSFSYKAVCAIRAASWSPRTFFIVAPDRQLWDRAKAFADIWTPHVIFNPLTAPPDDLGLTPGASAYHRVDELEARGAFHDYAQGWIAQHPGKSADIRDG